MLCHRHRCRKLRERADINWALRKLPRQLRPHVLTVGSCCSGLGVEKLAIAYLYGELQQHVHGTWKTQVSDQKEAGPEWSQIARAGGYELGFAEDSTTIAAPRFDSW